MHRKSNKSGHWLDMFRILDHNNIQRQFVNYLEMQKLERKMYRLRNIIFYSQIIIHFSVSDSGLGNVNVNVYVWVRCESDGPSLRALSQFYSTIFRSFVVLPIFFSLLCKPRITTIFTYPFRIDLVICCRKVASRNFVCSFY